MVMPESSKKYRLNIWYQSVEPARLLLGYVPYIKQKGRRGFRMVDKRESEHQTCGNKHISFGCFWWILVEVLLSFCKREPKSHTTPLPIVLSNWISHGLFSPFDPIWDYNVVVWSSGFPRVEGKVRKFERV
jgi:hypothetical protein